jgi:hypothetical protein
MSGGLTVGHREARVALGDAGRNAGADADALGGVGALEVGGGLV